MTTTTTADATRRTTRWTEDLVDTLARMCDAGMSYGTIAAELGLERNALLGDAFRRRAGGDTRFGPTVRVPRDPKPRTKPRSARGSGRPPKAPAVARTRPELRGLPLFCVAAAQAIMAPPSLALGLVDLDAGGCRYIAGDDRRCCGHPTVGSTSWCAAHARLVYAPRRGR